MAVMGYTRGDILRYVFLPQVLPRVRTLLRSGFTHLAFFMAQVFRSGGIIAPDHPYLQTANIGKYGLMDVLSLSASNITFDRQHIDKVIFFFSILAGIVILAIQFFLLLLSAVISPAAAKSSVGGGGKFTNFLTTENPQEDIAFRLMDRVFGIPDLFGSKDAAASVSGFHQALHGLFQF